MSVMPPNFSSGDNEDEEGIVAMPVSDAPIRRLNWGCGPVVAPGWINADIRAYPGVDIVRDIRLGLPLDDDSIDYIVSIHALPEIPFADLRAVLSELRRVLKPNGVLRLGLPDLDKAIHAYLRNDRDYFLIPDAIARSISGKLIVQMIWYGNSRTLFTADFTMELLAGFGFQSTRRCAYGKTLSNYPGIVEMDNRERESFFLEAIK